MSDTNINKERKRYTKNVNQVYHGRPAGARNRSIRYEVQYFHPIRSDVIIESKSYASLYEIARDLGVSYYCVGRVLRGEVTSKAYKVTDLRSTGGSQ